MTATVERYRPRFISERRMSPTNGCRFSVLSMAVQSVTLGERFTKPNGDRFDVAAMTSVMKRLRANSGGKVNGDSFNRPEAIRAWRVTFPDLIGHAVPIDERWSAIVRNLKSGHYGYSISGNVSEVRADSPLRRYVNEVGHELWLNAIHDASGDIYVYDPMGPQAHYDGFWVPARDVKAFSGKFMDYGRRVTIRFRKGSGTEAAKVTEQLRRVRRERNKLTQLLLTCSSDKETLREQRRAAVRSNEAWEAALDECRESIDAEVVDVDAALRGQAAAIAADLREFADEIEDDAG